MDELTDVVVIGGGVMGAASTYFLTRDGWRVTLIEQGALASGTSSACQSGVGFGLFADGDDLAWQRAAMAAYAGLIAEGFDLDYRREGALVVSERSEDMARMRQRVDQLRQTGLPVEWLEGQTLRQAEPRLAPAITGAAYLEESAQVSPMRVVTELTSWAWKRRATVQPAVRVTGVELKNETVVAVETSRGRIATRWLVLAAGVWSREIGGLMGLNVPVWPLKGHIVVTEPIRHFLKHYIAEAHYETGVITVNATAVGETGPRPGPPQVAAVLQNLPSGSILIGSSREFATLERDVSRERLAQMVRRATRLVPSLARIRALRSYAGLRPWTPDGRPLVGATQRVRGLVLATGHAGEGITGAVLTGGIVADAVAERQLPAVARPAHPDRFPLRGSG